MVAANELRHPIHEAGQELRRYAGESPGLQPLRVLERFALAAHEGEPLDQAHAGGPREAIVGDRIQQLPELLFAHESRQVEDAVEAELAPGGLRGFERVLVRDGCRREADAVAALEKRTVHAAYRVVFRVRD